MNESQLIDRLVAAGWKGNRAVLVGPGDDAAVLRGGVVVSTDLLVEDVHFRFRWISPVEAGFRAGAAALSDLAAMGAEPTALLVSLAVPGDPSCAVGIQRGVRRAGDRVAVSIVGGDVSRSPGPVVVDVVALGRGGRVVRRSGAAPGQALWISGALGGAAAAVAAWTRGSRPVPTARERFVFPPDRIPLGRALAAEGIARSMSDVSDGLVADARRVALASRATLVIREAFVPVDVAADGTLNLALEGGEDYELMFTADTDAEARILALGRELSVPLTRIGTVEGNVGVVLEGKGGRRRVPSSPGGGYDHFADSRVGSQS